jgi:hypothetical protein
MVSTAAMAEPATEFQIAEYPKRSHHVYLWPLNVHAGYGFVADAQGSAGGLSLGVDAATISYQGLVVDVASARAIFRSACVDESPCGAAADLFLGTRAAYAIYLGEDRVHQFSVGAGMGWGSVGGGWSGRPNGGDGQWLVAPSVRYAAFGLFGAEVAALLPLAGDLGDRYPVALTFNLHGAGMIILAFAGFNRP